MTVVELVKLLQSYPQDLAVIMTDGHEYWTLGGKDLSMDLNTVDPQPYHLTSGDEVDGGVLLVLAMGPDQPSSKGSPSSSAPSVPEANGSNHPATSEAPIRVLEISEGNQLPTVHVFRDRAQAMRVMLRGQVEVDGVSAAEIEDVFFDLEYPWRSPDDSIWTYLPFGDLPEEDHTGDD